MVNAYAPAENESVHFDSLLTYLVANDVRTPALNIDSKVFPLPLDLLWISPEGYPLWACSDLKPEGEHYESVDWWHKRISSVHLTDWSSNPNIKNVGRNKDYRVPLRTVLADKDAVYYTSHGESGCPTYLVVDDVSADYVISGRGGDISNYNWEDADCDCGECSACFAMMIAQDRAFLQDNALTQKKS